MRPPSCANACSAGGSAPRGRGVRAARPTDRPTVFFVDLDDGETVVVKVARPDRAASPVVEAWAYGECRRHGVTVPDVLAVDHEPEAVVVRALPGRNMWDHPPVDDDAAVWRAAGAELRVLHDVCVPGFGPLTHMSGDVRGVSEVWSPVVDFAREEGVAALADRGLVTTDETDRLLGRYEQLEPRLQAVTEGRLLHGDVQAGHIFVNDAGAYIGMIDFDQCQAGDPRWDLARVTLWDGEEALDLLLDGYGTEVLERDDRELLLPLYLLAFCIHHIVSFPFSADPAFAAHLLERSNYKRVL